MAGFLMWNRKTHLAEPLTVEIHIDGTMTEQMLDGLLLAGENAYEV
jgi:hypothetical protein